MRIVIDVEREDGPVTSTDLRYVVARTCAFVEAHDARVNGPAHMSAHRGGDPDAKWSYSVREVPK